MALSLFSEVCSRVLLEEARCLLSAVSMQDGFPLPQVLRQSGQVFSEAVRVCFRRAGSFLPRPLEAFAVPVFAVLVLRFGLCFAYLPDGAPQILYFHQSCSFFVNSFNYFVSITMKNGDVGEFRIFICVAHILRRSSVAR